MAAARLCACFSSAEQYESLGRQSSVPGPREPAGMAGLREVLDTADVETIVTGGVLHRSQMERMYESLDTDRSNSLDRDELKDLVRLIWDLQGENRATVDLFKKMDDDGDGKLSKTEFCTHFPGVVREAHMHKMQREAVARLKRRGAKPAALTPQHIESLWDFLDTNRDGTLDKEELGQITKLLCPRSESDRAWAFERLDANQDGRVDKGEFGAQVGYVLDVLSARANSGPEPTDPAQTAAVACFAIGGRLSEPVKQKLWRAFNADGDDKLDHDELKPLVYFLWVRTDQDQQMMDLFKKLDADGSGKIEKQEFLDTSEEAFALAAAAWPRPSPGEVAAAMRVYAAEPAMQYECCARIVSLCAVPNSDDAALLVAHGAVEATVAALKSALGKAKGFDEVAELAGECCSALAGLTAGEVGSWLQQDCPSLEGGTSLSQQVARARLAEAGVEALVQAVEELPDSFPVQMHGARALAAVAADHAECREAVRAASAKATEAKEAYLRKEHGRMTLADRQAVAHSNEMALAEAQLQAALDAP